ncbi:pentatricopeptide repeat-containing protein At2g41080 [Typha latifolia]|uniref:pentatricopeptide repeat-containing protein At2g41080 n=1 Tax=Typha latifolia TaxID=4733 RepID=UPI003C2C0E5B
MAKLLSVPKPSLSKSKEHFLRLCSKGSLREALQLQGFLPELWSNTNLFTHLLRGCRLLRHVHQLHAYIVASGAASDRFTANHLLHAYSELGMLGTAQKLFGKMPRRNVMSSNILIGGFVKKGDLDSARKLFEEMPERNVATWNAMVTGLTHFGYDEEGLDFFVRMRREGMRPDEFSLGSAFRCCAGLKDIVLGRQIHGYVTQSGLESDMCVGSSLAHMYMRCGALEKGESVLRGLPFLNIVSCNTIIAGRAQNGDSEGALEYFCLMKAARLAPDEVTFVSVISSCSYLGALSQGQQVHAQAVKVGVDLVVPVKSSLVNMYSRCGCLGDSARVFSEPHLSDLVLWSSMIAAYGFHGHGQEAIQLFKEMVRKGTEPSEVTFLSLLYACSHSGLKDEGMEYLRIMTETYGLKPSVRHYTCMVDLLGRSGCLDEAEALIMSMPVTADGVIWKTLLSACKIHRNAEMAERVAEHVFRLDPQDSASYVLLSNIHATGQRWNDVSEVRRVMREKRVRKEPGISWVELKGKVHQFCTGDRFHPMSSEIDEFLKEIVSKMKQCGYVPNTSTVLHDMEDEEKEYSLVHHSEKLAIVFALLRMPEGAPIRVMKNLRVCDDCHVAIKYISQIACREIVVRDVSRFHHFRDGKCSCGDYW